MAWHDTPEPSHTTLAPPAAAASQAPATQLSLNLLSQPAHDSSEQDTESDLQGPLPSASPAMNRRSQWQEEEQHKPSVELVTYELELDTGCCKVSSRLKVKTEETV